MTRVTVRPRPDAVALRLASLLAALLAAGRTAIAAPPVVPWPEAIAHVGEYVTIEGDVAAARLERETLVLEFDAANSQAFRAVLLIPMITSLPARPDRVYAGHRVRVTGQVQRFKGRPEMVLQSPGQIRVVDHAGAPATDDDAADADGDDDLADPPPAAAAPVPPPPSRSAPAQPRSAAPSAPAPLPSPPVVPAAPVAPPPTTSAPPTSTTTSSTSSTTLRPVDPCTGARQEWQSASAQVRNGMQALDQCLGAGTYRCRREASGLAPALSALEWAEQRVRAACP